MEFGTGSGYPPSSGGEGQINGSRMQQADRQQGGPAYHQGQHQLNQGLFVYFSQDCICRKIQIVYKNPCIRKKVHFIKYLQQWILPMELLRYLLDLLLLHQIRHLLRPI